MTGHFELKDAAGGRFRFNLVASNGATILTSGLFVAKDAALAAIELVRGSAPHDELFERKVAKNKEVYFVLHTTEGDTLGKSEMYRTTTSMETGIKSVMRNAPEATVKDVTKGAATPEPAPVHG